MEYARWRSAWSRRYDERRSSSRWKVMRMASSEEYLAYVMDLLDDVPDVRHRKMMGEYILYASGKVFGGIYDDRFLVKIMQASKRLLPDASEQLPYEGAKLMLLIDFEDRDRLAELVAAMLSELPESKKRKK